jgi:hypothetical protein
MMSKQQIMAYMGDNNFWWINRQYRGIIANTINDLIRILG